MMESTRSRKGPKLGLGTLGLALLLVAAAEPARAQLGPPPAPAGNPVTASKVRLGQALFWDEQLSSTRTVACGTCHISSAAGGDPRSLGNPMALHPGPDGVFGGGDEIFGSPGVPLNDAGGFYLQSSHFSLAPQVTRRRTTSSINAGYSPELFWDGRAGNALVDPVTKQVVLASGAALESQALAPLVSDVEMAHVDRTWPEVLARVAEAEPLALAVAVPTGLLGWLDGRGYPDLFAEAFGTPDVTAPRIAMAIASYERILLANQTPFDEFLTGADSLTPLELAGRGVFVASSCDRCHSLEIMSDHLYHYTGVRPPADDAGRFEVTEVEDDRARMRTPSLRNLELRPPYMHNGRFDTIDEVVDFYDRGGDFDAPNKDPRVRELFLTPQEKAALVAFLGRPLTDPRLATERSPFQRPTLYTETSRVPEVLGAGVPGSGGVVPAVVALEPPMVGNPSFTVAVDRGLGGAQAWLAIDSSDPGLSPPVGAGFAFEALILQGAGVGAGYGSVSLAIPADLPLAGSEWFGRWYVEDPGASGSVAVSRLFRFRIFEPLAATVLFVDGFESGDASRWSVP